MDKKEQKEQKGINVVNSPQTTPKLKLSELRIFKWIAGHENRKGLFPIIHHDIWALRKQAELRHWTANEVSIVNDKKDWIAMEKNDKHVKQGARAVFGIFINLDLVVLTGMPWIRKILDNMESQQLLEVKGYQETVHAESYELQVEAVAVDDAEKEYIRNFIHTNHLAKRLKEWADFWVNSEDMHPAIKYFALGFIEAGIFQPFFFFIELLRKLNRLPGVTGYNRMIVPDEGGHTGEFVVHWQYCVPSMRPPPEIAHMIVKSGTAVVSDFISQEVMPKAIGGVQPIEAIHYGQNQADVYLTMMGYPPCFGTKSTCRMMDKLSLNATVKVNFFERRPLQYQEAAKGSSEFVIDTSPIKYGGLAASPCVT